MRTITAIIADAGGPRVIARAAAKTHWPILATSIKDWRRIGIPDRYWPVIIKLSNASADELMHANRKVRLRAKRAPTRVVEADASQAA